MGKIYITSDTHFNHKNIIEYCNRPFTSVEEMNKVLIDNWNSIVTDDDTVFFLGDFCLGSKEEIIKFGSQLKGTKILIAGNHDTASSKIYTKAGFETVYKKPVIIKFYNFDITIEFSHTPKYEDNHYPNVCGHVHDKTNNDAMHYCACVELHDYKPVPLEDIVKYFKGQK